MLLRRFAIHLIFPGGLLAAASLWLLQFWQRPPEVTAFLPLVPGLVLAIGLLLGCRFNRTRLVYALVALAVADLCLKSAAGEIAPLVRPAVGLLLPVNLLVISFYAERGLLTPTGFFRLGLILMQPPLFHLLHYIHPQPTAAFLTASIWSGPFPAALPQLPLAATSLAFLVLLLRIVRRPSAMEAGFLWALICAQAPFLLGIHADRLTLWFAVAGVILIAALIEVSHGLAFRDELTGLPSRRALNEELLKIGDKYVVAMVDIDHFKKVNDAHGHDVGDQVLRMVAGRLQRVTGGGRPFRYGGEEFTVLFPGMTASEALPHLEALRKAVGTAPFILRHPSRPKKKPVAGGRRGGVGHLAVTVSIGISECLDGCSAQTVLRSADRALYKAKQGGRNRVCTQAARAA